ncbi:hypothetical protein, partial [Mycobacterium tuberculosis]
HACRDPQRPGATEPSDPALLAKIHANSC